MTYVPHPRQTENARENRKYAAGHLIDDLAHQYGNPEADRKAAAMKAAEEGRPAYWTKRSYHDATACLFVLTANEKSLPEALREWVDPRHPSKTADALLDTLIPLNTGAALAKESAWWRVAAGAGEAA